MCKNICALVRLICQVYSTWINNKQEHLARTYVERYHFCAGPGYSDRRNRLITASKPAAIRSRYLVFSQFFILKRGIMSLGRLDTLEPAEPVEHGRRTAQRTGGLKNYLYNYGSEQDVSGSSANKK